MQDAIDFYGSKAAIARELGISATAINAWPRRWGDLVPRPWAAQLEIITHGRLRMRPLLYPATLPKRGPKPKLGARTGA
jgi:hypothetical protein